MSDTNDERIPDPVHLRSLAQNDYMIDSGFLPDGLLLYEIAERMERTEALLREQTHKAIEAAFTLRDAKRERDEARREVCLWQGLDTGKTSEQVAEVRGWDCYTTQKREEAMDRLAKFDEENGLFDMKQPPSTVIKTLNGVVVNKNKAEPPQFDEDNGL